VYEGLGRYIGIRDTTPTLEQCKEHLATLDTSLNKSPPGCGPNTTTSMKASARNMDSKKGGTTGTASPAKEDCLTCNNCGQVGHISRNCPKRNLMKKLLQQALVGNDAPKAKSGHLCKDERRGGALTGRKKSGRLAREKEAKQETDSEAESTLDSLSDWDSEAGKGKGGQLMQLYLP